MSINIDTLKTFEDVRAHSLKDLFALYSEIRPDHGLKKFNDKKQASKHLLTFLSEERAKGKRLPKKPPAGSKAKAAGTKTASTRRRSSGRGPSYQDKLKEFFAERKRGTVDELCECLGCDSRNLSVAVSILKNPARTKEPMVLTYDRSKKTFTR